MKTISFFLVIMLVATVFAFPLTTARHLEKPDLSATGNTNTVSVKSLSFSTVDKVAESTGINPEVIESDLEILRPTKPSEIPKPTESRPFLRPRPTVSTEETSSSGSEPSFPTTILSGTGITTEENSREFSFYIGRQRQLDTDSGEKVSFRGRIVFPNEPGAQVTNYMIVDGTEVENIFGLVPIINGVPDYTAFKAKMLVEFDEKKGSFSNLFNKPGIVDFKITSFSREPYRPKVTPEKEDIYQPRPLPVERRPFWNNWFSDQEVEESISEGEDSGQLPPSDLSEQRERRNILAQLLDRIFRRG